MLKIKTIIVALTAIAGTAFVAIAAEKAMDNKQVDWSFNGPFGTFDRESSQRGFQVFKNVCANCHSLQYFTFRNLADLGYSEDMIKAFASEYTVVDKEPDEFGDMVERVGIPADALPSPFPNQNAARAANNGAYPVDLSLITKARADGPNYLYSLLTGYQDAPADMDMGDLYYNPYFPGHKIAMAAPLSDDLIEYEDGTPATLDNHAKDVVNFLHYVAEPKLEQRHRMGLSVMIFLLIMVVLTYLLNRKIWKPVKEGKTLWDHD